jgi:hypothetical protein
MEKPFKTIKEQYYQIMADKITVSLDDLNDNEKILIESGYQLFVEKLDDIKLLNDDIKRLTIELLNLKAMRD